MNASSSSDSAAMSEVGETEVSSGSSEGIGTEVLELLELELDELELDELGDPG